MALKLPKEKGIQAQILDWLRVNGAVAIRVNSGAFGGTYNGKKRFVKMNDTPGCSDILCCFKGTFLAVEVKRQKPVRRKAVADLTKEALHLAEQEAFLRSVNNAGGIGLFAASVADVQAALTNAGLYP